MIQQIPMLRVRSALATAVCGCLILLATRPVFAEQAAVEREAKPHRNMEVTWKLQAESVARHLGLNSESAEKLMEVYVAVRTGRQNLLKEIPKAEEGGNTARKQLVDEIDVKQRDKLKAALMGVSGKEQAEKAFSMLGSFNSRWDNYVRILQQFQLDEKQQSDAIDLTATYIEDYSKARSEASNSGERFSSITARELKATLDSGIAKLLSKDQLTQWSEATAFRSGGGKSAQGERKRVGKKGDRNIVETK